MTKKMGISELFSAPCLATVAPALENRAEMLARIESGELASIEFEAITFRPGKNRNALTFYETDLPGFAASFAGSPFLRDHNTAEIAARDGTILASAFSGEGFQMRVSLTTRRGMTDYVEGRIDRFSISWNYDEIHCSICKSTWMNCSHMPGRKYQADGREALCELVFTHPTGKECSAVNAPAVDGTHILASLSVFKEEQMKNIHILYDAPVEAGGGGETPAVVVDPVQQRLEANERAMALFLGEQERLAKLDEQSKRSDAVLAAQCGFLLKMALGASKLPEVTQARLRKQFDGTVFEPVALQAAIDEARLEVSALTGGQAVMGPGRVSLFSAEDQLQAAVDDLFGVPRDPAREGQKVHRLSGMKELYFMLTGDFDLHGGYDPVRAQLATTADFTGLVKNALNKVVLQAYERMGRAGYDWWKQIVVVDHFESLNDITATIVGTIGSLPEVQEQGEYTELPVSDSPETASFKKYGGYLPLTLEAIDRDETRKLKNFAVELGNAAMRNISEKVAYIFTQASAAGPTMADGGALFNATAVTSSGGHANLLTTALSASQWDIVAAAVYNQPMLVRNATAYYGTGKKQAIEPRFCLVPRALKKTAFDIFLNNWDTTTNVHADNLLKGQVVPLIVPEWTDVSDWAAVCDPVIAPSILLGERFGIVPEIYIAGRETDPAVFMNDEHRLKVRQFLAVAVGDFRPLHKSNV